MRIDNMKQINKKQEVGQGSRDKKRGKEGDRRTKSSRENQRLGLGE